MLNKENYVPWLYRLLRYAKSRPNGKLIYNSIINDPYVRRMIPEPDDELIEKELKQIKVDDQAIQTILLGLPEDIYAAVNTQNSRVQNIGNRNGLIGVPGRANHNLNGNGNLVAAPAKGNAIGHNGNQIRCYNCRGVGIQLQAEEFNLMVAAVDLDEIEKVNANCILMANLQQALTSSTQIDKALVYDSDESAENDNNVISEVTSVEQSGGTVEQHPAN
nr:hypothetical protein [Tanacetum cinerariifolium]